MKFLSSRRWLLLIPLVIGAAFYYQSYNGRIDVWNNQIKGCKRSRVRDLVQYDAWTTAHARALSQGQPQFAVRYLQYADVYKRYADEERRCDRLYPKPSYTG